MASDISEVTGQETEPELTADQVQSEFDKLYDGTSDTPTDDNPVEPGAEDESGSDWVTPEMETHYGMTADEVRGYGSAEVFQHAMTQRDIAMSAFMQQQPGDENPPQEQQEQPQQQKPAREVPQGAFKYEGIEFDDLDDLDPTVAQFAQQTKAMNDHYASQMAHIANQNAALQDQLASYENERYIDDFDTQRAALGEDYAELLGTGSVRDLPEGPQRDANQQLSETLDALTQVAKQSGRRVGAKALFQRALAATFSGFAEKKAQRQANEKSTKRLKDSKGRFTAQPTSRDSSPGLSKEEAARERFNRVADQIGLPKD